MAGITTNLWSCLRFALWLISVALLPFLSAMAQGGETNSVVTRPATTARQARPSPQDVAAGYERAGRKREAAALYEQIAHTNAAARKVLAHRLVTIYSEVGETNKALAWARQVMRENPDPQAYLAAVHGRLGQWKQAREILEREIAGNTNATRAVTLRWQLADVCAEAGDNTQAGQVLSEAANLAKGTPMEAAARRRLKAHSGGTP